MKVSPAIRLLMLLVLSATAMRTQTKKPLKLEQTIELSNGEGVDAAGQEGNQPTGNKELAEGDSNPR